MLVKGGSYAFMMKMMPWIGWKWMLGMLRFGKASTSFSRIGTFSIVRTSTNFWRLVLDGWHLISIAICLKNEQPFAKCSNTPPSSPPLLKAQCHLHLHVKWCLLYLMTHPCPLFLHQHLFCLHQHLFRLCQCHSLCHWHYLLIALVDPTALFMSTSCPLGSIGLVNFMWLLLANVFALLKVTLIFLINVVDSRRTCSKHSSPVFGMSPPHFWIRRKFGLVCLMTFKRSLSSLADVRKVYGQLFVVMFIILCSTGSL